MLPTVNTFLQATSVGYCLTKKATAEKLMLICIISKTYRTVRGFNDRWTLDFGRSLNMHADNVSCCLETVYTPKRFVL